MLPPITSATTTDESTALDYAIGHVEGPIQLASLDFAGFTIPKQAYCKISLCLRRHRFSAFECSAS